MAKRSKEYKVTLAGPVYGALVKWFRHGWPAERYAFLAGAVTERHVYEVTHVYHPSEQEEWNTNGAFSFTAELQVAAARWAIRDGAQLLGIAHSHPYRRANSYGVMHSLRDAQMQAENHFTLSIVCALFGKDKLAMACWLNGFNAALDILVRPDGARAARPLPLEVDLSDN